MPSIEDRNARDHLPGEGIIPSRASLRRRSVKYSVADNVSRVTELPEGQLRTRRQAWPGARGVGRRPLKPFSPLVRAR